MADCQKTSNIAALQTAKQFKSTFSLLSFSRAAPSSSSALLDCMRPGTPTLQPLSVFLHATGLLGPLSPANPEQRRDDGMRADRTLLRCPSTHGSLPHYWTSPCVGG
ncbi:hypothetical protein TRVL_08674 [Trypanosoma vivax]|nr:hypothetical protein TRVL_08674 [Trypanosoma vivax]